MHSKGIDSGVQGVPCTYTEGKTDMSDHFINEKGLDKIQVPPYQHQFADDDGGSTEEKRPIKVELADSDQADGSGEGHNEQHSIAPPLISLPKGMWGSTSLPELPVINKEEFGTHTGAGSDHDDGGTEGEEQSKEYAPIAGSDGGDTDDDDSATLIQGERQIEEYVDQGYGIFLMVGVSGTGKTQVLEAFQRIQGIPLNPFKKTGDRVHPNPPNEVKAYPIKKSLTQSKAMFVDASGENFSGLYPHLVNERGTTTKEQLRIPEIVASKLLGLVLLIDIKSFFGDTASASGEDKSRQQLAREQQIKIVTWILMVFRWFLNGGNYHENTILPLHDHINAKVGQMTGRKTRLNIPVQVLFSKADELYDFPVPNADHILYPLKDSPFFIAYHHLSELHEALLEHANYFRYDFVHSIVNDPDTGIVKKNEPPCGVELSLKWLLNHRSSGWSTQHWIQIQQMIDTLLLRGRRWREPPKTR
ncbi:MAG: hypothetical protein ABFS56_04445 [Pseudomonadota bacterium]